MKTTTHEKLSEQWLNNRDEFWTEVRDRLLSASEEERKKSYVHDNGFAKLTLWVSEDCMTETRLHFWKEAFTETNIHNHCFNLTSTVLFGAVLDREYQESNRGTEYGKYLYTKRGSDQKYGLESKGTSNVELISATLRRSGDTYLHPYNQLHSSESATFYSLTLFTTSFLDCPETADVFSNRYSENTQALQSPSMEQDAILKIVNLASEVTR